MTCLKAYINQGGWGELRPATLDTPPPTAHRTPCLLPCFWTPNTSREGSWLTCSEAGFLLPVSWSRDTFKNKNQITFVLCSGAIHGSPVPAENIQIHQFPHPR